MSLSFDTLFLIFVVFSFAGWIMEVVYAGYKTHEFVNRGFLYGPFCPIYGTGIVLIVIAIEWLQQILPNEGEINLVAMYFIIVFLTTLLEFITGFVLEKIFHTKWWDYSNQKLSIKGYVSVGFSLIWGFGGLFMIKYVVPFVTTFIGGVATTNTRPLVSGLMVYFLIDIVFTVKSLVDLRRIILNLESLTVQAREEWQHFKVELEENLNLDIVTRLGTEMHSLKDHLNTEVHLAKSQFENGWQKTKTSLDLERGELSGKKLKEIRANYEAEYTERKQHLVNEITNSRLYKAFPSMKQRTIGSPFEENELKLMYQRLKKKVLK